MSMAISMTGGNPIYDPYTLAAIVLPLLAIQGFFSGSELALFSADKLRLQALGRQGSKRALKALELATHPERVLSTTLLMVSLCVIGTSTLIALHCLARDEHRGEWAAVAITSTLIVLFGELIPKTLFQRNADRLAPWVAYPVQFTFWAFFPITRLLSFYTTRLSRVVGPIEELLTGKRHNTREELRSLLSYGRRESEIRGAEKRMIKRIFDFSDSEAKHAFIPLVKIEAIDATANLKEALERFRSHRHSRMPVFDERIDNIVGVLELQDLHGMSDLEQPIRNVVGPAHYVSETHGLHDLLVEMRREDNDLVVVVDEYGGAVGILTFEDVVEEIVGEINDEYDSESTPYRETSPGTWVIQARMEIQELNERLRLELPEGDYETLAGFLLQMFGRIPEQGDELYFDTPDGTLKFIVRKANERTIEQITIERIETNSSKN